MKMLKEPAYMAFEDIIVKDEKFLSTFVSYILASIVFINLSSLQSPLIGVTASIIYIIINGIFLGHVFFGSQGFFFRLTLGSFLFVMLLGFVAWLILKISDLGVMNSALVLFIGATSSSILNKRMKHKDAKPT